MPTPEPEPERANNEEDDDVVFLAQVMERQQHQVRLLYNLLMMSNPGMDDLEYLISELDTDYDFGRIKPPQGGKRLTEDTILAMSEEECTWHFR